MPEQPELTIEQVERILIRSLRQEGFTSQEAADQVEVFLTRFAEQAHKTSTVRNIAVGLPVRAGHVLVINGEDHSKDETFHRAIGGGIEFGETAEQAVRREFQEEVGVTLDTVELLAVVENLFEYEGQPGHEIAHIFTVTSAELDELPFDAELEVLDEGSPVRWVKIDGTANPFYPDTVRDLLTKLNAGSSAV